MSWLVLLSLVSIAICAPLGEQAASLEGLDDHEIDKKAKEFMMFDNEQNARKETSKRSDPSMLEEESVDLDGQVHANEPVDIASHEEYIPENESEAAETEESLAQDESDIPEIDNAGEPELGSEEINDVIEPETSTELEEIPNPDDINYEEYLKGLQESSYYPNYMDMLGKLSQQKENAKWGRLYDAPAPYINIPTRYQRYRRSQNRRFNNVPILQRAVKRARRIKRDLYYPSESLGQEYDPYEEQYLVDPYDTYEPTGNEDLVSLLDLLDNAKAYDDFNYGTYGGNGNGYEWPEEDLDDMVYEEEPTFYVPKRQAGLTFVPGIKRSKAFYPYFEEPHSHFDAFVPQKRRFRDYEDEYERVMRLAAALREQAEYPEEYGYPKVQSDCTLLVSTV